MLVELFGWKWAGLAALFSRQLPNGSKDFFLIFSIFKKTIFRYETIETHALSFLTLIILVIDGVSDYCKAVTKCKIKDFIMKIENVSNQFENSISNAAYIHNAIKDPFRFFGGFTLNSC